MVIITSESPSNATPSIKSSSTSPTKQPLLKSAFSKPLRRPPNTVFDSADMSPIKATSSSIVNPIDSTSKAAKKAQGVHFNETVWMSLEDFKSGRIDNLSEIKNLRIELDLDLSKPENCRVLRNNSNSNNNSYHHNSSSSNKKRSDDPSNASVTSFDPLSQDETYSTRKIESKKETQRIQLRKVIDDLDLWQSELTQQKKRQNQNSSHNLHIKEPTTTSTAPSSFVRHPYTRSYDPTLNTNIIDSILNPSSLTSNNNTRNNNFINQQTSHQPHTPQPSIANLMHQESSQEEDTNFLQEQQQQDGETSPDKQPTGTKQQQHHQFFFPKSLSQIPLRPVTLTSMKLKKVSDLKFKTVSRYVVDSDNKIVTKTDAQLQAEQNNVIINQIFKNKLSRVVETAQPQSKSEYQEIVQDQTALFQKNTIAHFKSLHHLQKQAMAEKGQIITSNPRDPMHPKYGTIEYAKLYGELFEDKLLQRNVQLEQEKSTFVKQDKYLFDKEKEMLSTFQAQSVESKSLKSKLNVMRLKLNDNAQSRKALQVKISNASDKFDKQIYNIENASAQEMLKALEISKKKHQAIVFNSKLYTDEITVIKQQKAQKVTELQSQIDELMHQYNHLSSEVDILSAEQNALKESKKNIKYQLKQHYLNELKHRDDESNANSIHATYKSLVWTVMKLFQINADVTYNLFPSFLDETSIQFLIAYARLELTKHDLKLSLKQFLTTQNTSTSSSATSQESMPLFSLNTILSQLMAQRKHIRREGFVNQSGSFLSPSILQSKHLSETKLVEAEIRKIDAQIQELKSSESERIISSAVKDSSINQKRVLLILSSLFGSAEADLFYAEFLRRRAKLESTLLANKTFHFSTALHASLSSSRKPSMASITSSTMQQNSITEPTSQPHKLSQLLLGIKPAAKNSNTNNYLTGNNSSTSMQSIKHNNSFSSILTPFKTTSTQNLAVPTTTSIFNSLRTIGNPLTESPSTINFMTSPNAPNHHHHQHKQQHRQVEFLPQKLLTSNHSSKNLNTSSTRFFPNRSLRVSLGNLTQPKEHTQQ